MIIHINFVTHDANKTIQFYCEIIGLELGNALSIDTSQSLYFYIPGQKVAILHVGNASASKNQPKFERYADLSPNHQGEFSTGAVDHFCLVLDDHDYDHYLSRIKNAEISFKTYCHEDIRLKQIWLLDPNGVRVELNFL